jgi:hypothetical protein
VSPSDPVLLTSLPTDLDGPAPLSLQLEICRLRAELEAVEERLTDARRAADPEGLATPFADRAALLVDRMVASLRETLHTEAERTMATAELEAAARVESGRHQAQAVLAAARADLARVLEERADAVAAEHRRWSTAYRAWEHLQAENGTVISAEALRAADLLDPAAPPPAGMAAGLDGPEAQLGSDALVGPEVLVERGQAAAVAAEAARTDVAFEAWMAVAPARATGYGTPELDVAHPPLGEAEGLGGARRWLLPLEIAASLAAVAVLVVVALIVIG